MAVPVKDAERRREILDAALACFLKFGYGKTSLDDIAKHAKLSRPLIYKKYPNKEAIFGAVYDDVFESLMPQVHEVVGSKRPRKEKLLRLCEIMCIGPWDMMSEAPMVEEFYVACETVIPDICAKHEKRWTDALRTVLGDREAADVFDLALDGLMGDKPSTTVFRKRVTLLVARFAA
jgi:TetR/AcrR family transcriptional regulator, transcriptional repressor of aconitase